MRRIAILGTIGLGLVALPGGQAKALAQVPNEGTCIEKYHVYFEPGISLTTPSSGTFDTRRDELGSIECDGTLNGQDITGRGRGIMRGTYGEALGPVTGGDVCGASIMKVDPVIKLKNAAGETVHIEGHGTVFRAWTAAAVLGEFNDVPVTGVIVSQPDQNCGEEPITSVRLTIVRAIGVGAYEEICSLDPARQLC